MCERKEIMKELTDKQIDELVDNRLQGMSMADMYEFVRYYVEKELEQCSEEELKAEYDECINGVY